MAILNNLDGLMSILGAAQTARVLAPNITTLDQNQNGIASNENGSGYSESGIGNDETTLSSVGSAISMSASTTDVRTNKVAEIQAAIASGMYSVSAQDMASRVVDSMLGNTLSSSIE